MWEGGVPGYSDLLIPETSLVVHDPLLSCVSRKKAYVTSEEV